jgi:CHASE2 domain-containing sensor protein
VRASSWMRKLMLSVGVGGIVGCAVIASVSVAMARQPIIPPVPTALAVFAFHLCTADE